MAVEDLISQVVIESRFLPRIVLDKPLAKGTGKPNFLLKLLQPRITVLTPVASPVVVHPYGDPQTNYWPEVKIGLAVLGIIAGVVIIKAVR